MDYATFCRLADRVVELSKGYKYRTKPPKDPSGWEAPTASRKTWRRHDGKGSASRGARAPTRAPAALPFEHGDQVRVEGLPDYTEVWGVGDYDDFHRAWAVLVMDPKTRHKLWTHSTTVTAAPKPAKKRAARA